MFWTSPPISPITTRTPVECRPIRKCRNKSAKSTILPGETCSRPLHLRLESRSTIGGGGDTTIPSPGWSPKQPLPRIELHDPLYDRQAYPELNSFHQGVGQICPRERLFSCRPLPKRGQICDIPDLSNR